MTTEEIVAVLAHEIGHYKKKHTLKMLVFSIIETALMFWILGLMLGNYSQDIYSALGGE
jgi:STE24 endopeptidase